MAESILLTVDNQRFAVDLASSITVVQACAPTGVPHASEYLAGLIDMGSRVVPLVNVRKLLGLQSRDMELSDQFLVCQHESHVLALWVDRVIEVLTDKEHTPAEVERDLQLPDIFLCATKHDEDVVFVLDLKKIAHLINLQPTLKQ